MTIEIEHTDSHWDAAFAATLLGKTLLMNLTFLDEDGEVQERQQFFGVVIDATEHEGIVLDLLGEHDGDTYTLPPQTSAIQKAEAGVTSLAGDKPDFVASWIIHGAPEVANDLDEEV
ncbi:hypothetical protein OVA11_16775 [Caulobacter sp. SL161]|uniref:hypothetical protein n=1 Tax=Caulobacter sp. SL161 TaxID=2995156 RepID=UPI0022759EF0|nr:hypothetical protein [Caulobacter sp. SL161]MCY1648656.1 hypothetical protein [Caulobacter sp. SL161]